VFYSIAVFKTVFPITTSAVISVRTTDKRLK